MSKKAQTLILRKRVLRVNMIYQVYVTQDNNDLIMISENTDIKKI